MKIKWTVLLSMYNDDPHVGKAMDEETLMFFKLKYGELTMENIGSIIAESRVLLGDNPTDLTKDYTL